MIFTEKLLQKILKKNINEDLRVNRIRYKVRVAANEESSTCFLLLSAQARMQRSFLRGRRTAESGIPRTQILSHHWAVIVFVVADSFILQSVFKSGMQQYQIM